MMNKTKERIISILLQTERDGMEDMVNFLENGSDFFAAPASTRYHLAHRGGLAEHSLSVYRMLVKLNVMLGTRIHPHLISTTALLHDVCKTGYYVEVQKWRKDDYGKWESYTAWGVDDKLPLGHGEKSLFLIGKFLQLTDPEAAAIRWHMGCYIPSVTSDYQLSQTFNTAKDKYPLVTLLFSADYLSSQLLEG